MIKYPVPDALKIETYDRRPQVACFERVDLGVTFRPGKGGVGLIVRQFIDAIVNHDAIVKTVEERWMEIDELRRISNRINKKLRSFDGAWSIINEFPQEFIEYTKLLPKMKNIEMRLKMITDVTAKAKAQSEYDRFKELLPRYSKVAIAYQALEACRVERDIARDNLLNAEKAFQVLREEERRIANAISDDHIRADDKKVHISSIFPNVRPGFILSKINDIDVEYMKYDDAMQVVRRQKSPHNVEFRRYDYRYDVEEKIWRSLQELRESGVFVEDPMLVASNLVSAASTGDTEMVKTMIFRGDDPNSRNHVGMSAVMAAAASRHIAIVTLLIKSGADVNSRDINQMTPLLASVERGYIDMTRLLLDFGADRKASDRHGRGALFFAVMSGQINVVKQFIGPFNKNIPDLLWGFTPLHQASNLGNLELVKYLCEYTCSLYRKDKSNKTPEDIAISAGHNQVAFYLRQRRWDAPGQSLPYLKDIEVEMWFGNFDALDINWISDIEFTHILCFQTKYDKPMKLLQWYKKDGQINVYMDILECDDDDETEESWENLKTKFSKIIDELRTILQKGHAKVLVCDPTGNSTSPAILAALYLIRYQQRIEDTVQACTIARPSVRLSPSLLRGLEVMQGEMDAKKLLRMQSKVRTAVMLSSSF